MLELMATMWALSGKMADFSLTEPLIDEKVIVDNVCDALNIKKEELVSPSRARHLAEGRFIAMFLIRDSTRLTLKQTGKVVGREDHATVLHGLRTYDALIQTCPVFRCKAEKVFAKMKGGYDC